jgi:hypothetical protein
MNMTTPQSKLYYQRVVALCSVIRLLIHTCTTYCYSSMPTKPNSANHKIASTIRSVEEATNMCKQRTAFGFLRQTGSQRSMALNSTHKGCEKIGRLVGRLKGPVFGGHTVYTLCYMHGVKRASWRLSLKRWYEVGRLTASIHVMGGSRPARGVLDL